MLIFDEDSGDEAYPHPQPANTHTYTCTYTLPQLCTNNCEKVQLILKIYFNDLQLLTPSVTREIARFHQPMYMTPFGKKKKNMWTRNTVHSIQHCNVMGHLRIQWWQLAGLCHMTYNWRANECYTFSLHAFPSPCTYLYMFDQFMTVRAILIATIVNNYHIRYSHELTRALTHIMHHTLLRGRS